MKAQFENPQPALIAAHEAYLVGVRALRDAEDAGDAAAVRRLRRRAEQATTRRHGLVRAATPAMRHVPRGRA